MANAGPTPCAPISASNNCRSSSVANAYRVWASSRMWWWIQQNSSAPSSPAAPVKPGEAAQRYPTPATSMVNSAPRRASNVPRNEPIIGRLRRWCR